MKDWYQQWQTVLGLVRERVPGGDRPVVLWSALGGVPVLLVLGFSWWWQAGPAEGQLRVTEVQQRIVCAVCDYDQLHSTGEIRRWQRDEGGMYPCPGCGAKQADRFRSGGLRVFKPKPANVPEELPS